MLLIRPETKHDIDAIRRVTSAAFAPVAYSSQTEAAIVDALRDAGALTSSIVAVLNNEVVGHVACSPVTIDGMSRDWYGLGPVSVRPDQQQRGIGSRLIREVLTDLIGRGAKGCVVLGEPAYYNRFGFKHDDNLVFNGAPPAYFLRLSFGDYTPSGQVDYHPGFNAR